MALQQPAPLMVHWPFFKVVYYFLPALILLPFLLLKPNRRLGAWLMLIPFGLIVALAAAGQQITLPGFGNALAYAFPYIAMLGSSLCILCLILHAVPAWSFTAKLIAVPALAILPGALILFFSQGDARIEYWFIPAAYAVIPLILLVSFYLAGRLCRKHWGGVRFSLLVFLWNLLFLSGLMLLFAGYQFVRVRELPVDAGWLMILLPLIIRLGTAAIILFIIAFPFILVAFLSPLYRARLKAVFNVVLPLLPEQPVAAMVPPSPGPAS